jgi:hypothetical protein
VEQTETTASLRRPFAAAVMTRNVEMVALLKLMAKSMEGEEEIYGEG